MSESSGPYFKVGRFHRGIWISSCSLESPRGSVQPTLPSGREAAGTHSGAAVSF